MLHDIYAPSRMATSFSMRTSRNTAALTCLAIFTNGCLSTPTFQAPRQSLWKQLNAVEVQQTASWLLAQPDLNLSAAATQGSWHNSMYAILQLTTAYAKSRDMPWGGTKTFCRVSIDRLLPNKSDALTYFAAQTPQSPPPRYAHIVLNYRATAEPYYQDIIVGPLPNSDLHSPAQASEMFWMPLEYPLTRKTDGKVRDLDADKHDSLQSWLFEIGATVADITTHLLNGSATGAANDTIDIVGTTPASQDEYGRTSTWYMFRTKPTDFFEANTLLPTGLYFSADTPGRDPRYWKVETWFYNGYLYPTANDLRHACFAIGFEKLGVNIEGDWARTEPQEPILLPADLPLPTFPNHHAQSRFLLDVTESYVEWMGWSFYISFSQDTGVSLFNIKHHEETILYELSLQEVLAHYAGNNPFHANSAPLDSREGLGLHAHELISGFDCPSHANFLNTTIFHNDKARVHPRSICLFENTDDAPIQRHTNIRYVTATKNTYLTIRWVSTMGDYDFIFSYSLFQDGTIEVKVLASGYIVAAISANNSDYGYRIQENLSGSMHDHVMNFKADFDLVTPANSIDIVQIVPVTEQYPWAPGQLQNSMKLNHSLIGNEDAGHFNWDSNERSMFIVLNQEAKTRYGENRGYRIQKHTGASHLTVQNSPVLSNAARWATSDIRITAHHDHEPRSSHPYNNQDLHNPPINFDSFFDGESLNQTDLVVWFNLGMHHVPQTGDLPNTVTTSAISSVRLIPHDFWPVDQSRQGNDQIRIMYNASGATAVVRSGRDMVNDGSEEQWWNYRGVFGQVADMG